MAVGYGFRVPLINEWRQLTSDGGLQVGLPAIIMVAALLSNSCHVAYVCGTRYAGSSVGRHTVWTELQHAHARAIYMLATALLARGAGVRPCQQQQASTHKMHGSRR
jgi:hypothetical protein